MSIGAETLRKLADLRLEPEQMAGVLGILADIQAGDEDRKRNQRERTRRHRDMKRDGNVTVTSQERYPFPLKENPPDPLKKTTPIPRDTDLGRERAEIANEFESEFWPVFPRKVSKGQAAKAWAAARKRADLPEIMAGARRYAEERRLEDKNFTKHPATWLNADGWLDEPAPSPALRVVPGHGPPRPVPKRTGDRMFDRLMSKAAEGREPEPDPDPEPEPDDERTINGFAFRR